MKFTIGIKPTILTGRGTTKDAKARFRGSISGCCVYSSNFGFAYTNTFAIDATKVYGYNIEVFKRGKHRHNKHFVVYRYEFPIEMFNLLNIEIHQGPRTFKITPKKKL